MYQLTHKTIFITRSEEQAQYIQKLLNDLQALLECSNSETVEQSIVKLD